MRRCLIAIVALMLAACASTPPRQPAPISKPSSKPSVKKAPSKPTPPANNLDGVEASGAGREIVMYALGLLDVGYQFGGKNPEAGLDCSGMVAFIYRNALGMELRGSAADFAKRGRNVSPAALEPGDLVFFNTRGKPFSHVGIFIGDNKFVHAPSTNGKIRIESMASSYFASRFEGGRTLLR